MAQIDVQKIRSIAEPVITGLGYELVDLEWKHESGSWILRVFIDKAGPPPQDGVGRDAGVSHEDCVHTSRNLSAELDVADPIHVPYSLEVSSPGLNRPLRAERDFSRYVGRRARIRTRHPVGESRRNFAGTLKAVEAGKVRIEVDGQEYEIPVDDVEKANLEFEF